VLTPLSPDARIERPAYAWLAIALEVFTAVGAIPVGVMLLSDPSGAAVGFPAGWIEATPFGSYLVPGLYLFAINGVAMLVLAALSVQRHRWAPGLTVVLGAGLLVWIGVQLVVMPETSTLQAAFGAIGLTLVVVGVGWVRRLGWLRLG
jgi:hypothetical protein